MAWQATSKFQLSLDYYKQLQSDWLRYVSRWRRFAPHFGIIWMVIGVALILFAPTVVAVGIAFIVAGAFQIYQHLQHQRKWLKDRLNEKSFNHEVEIEFTEERINIKGPQGTGFCAWKAFERCQVTPNGLFLWPRKGVNIYIPDSSLTPLDAKMNIAKRVGCLDTTSEPAIET